MDESQNRGTTSLVDLSKGLSRLAEIAAHPSLQLVKTALGSDASLHLVGGAVRDALSGKEDLDIDLTTALAPDKVQKRLVDSNIKVVPTGVEHGTVAAIFESGNIEITTFRRPSSRRESQFGTIIQEDLSGRDFTINAIAFDLNTQQLVDPFNGIADISEGILRAVGNARDRFLEDPHRMLRLVRFGPAAGRQIDAGTYSAVQELAPQIQDISPERIRVELCKIISSEFAPEAFRQMQHLGLLKHILPEMLPSIGFEQNEFHVHDVFEHTLSVLERAPKENQIVRWAALYHDLGKPHTLSVGDDGRRHFYDHERVSYDLCRQSMERLKFSNKEIDRVSLLVKLHMRPLDCGAPGVRRLMRDLSDEFDDWKSLKRADAPPVLGDDDFYRRLASFEALVKSERERLASSGQGSKLAINGHDIMQMGIKEGRKVGTVLKQLEELVLDDPQLNTKEELLRRAQEFLGN